MLESSKFSELETIDKYTVTSDGNDPILLPNTAVSKLSLPSDRSVAVDYHLREKLHKCLACGNTGTQPDSEIESYTKPTMNLD